MISRFLLAILLAAAPAGAQVAVTTFQNDPQRTGANTEETVLTPTNVHPWGFGRLYSRAVDGQVYAQPVYVPGVNIPGKGLKNVVFAATMHDSVYAFDADTNAGTSAQPFWKASFVNGISVTPVPVADVGNGYGDIQWEIGVCGTPVIDASSGTLYVSAKTKESSGGGAVYVHRLHALDIATGAEKYGGPVVIDGSVAGVGYNGLYGVFDASGGRVPFNARNAHQRAGLLLSNGNVYVAFGAHEDKDPYHGWVFGFKANDLTRAPSVFCSTPNGDRGGVWQAGGGLAADADGAIYFSTGNGGYDGVSNVGSSVVKLNNAAGLALADWFTPFDYAQLNAADLDLGSVGVTVLPAQAGPNPRLLLAGGKNGALYLLNRDSLGRFNAAGNGQIVQYLPGAMPGMAWTNPAYWNGRVYAVGVNGPLKAWSLTNGLLSAAPVSQGGAPFGYTGASPAVSANGSANGIVWTIQVDGYASSSPGVLHAHDAADLSRELYNSAMMGTRDTCGQALKFTVPTVAAGRAYVGTGAGTGVQGGALYVYGRIADTTPLILESAVATGPNAVTVIYNRPLQLASATNLANYPFSGGVTASAAAIGPTGRSVNLTTSKLNPGVAYQVFVSGVKDTAETPHTLPASSTTFYYLTLNGDGLMGQYWSNTTSFQGAATLTRLDPMVDSSWGTGAPAPGISADNFCVRWTGFMQPPTTDQYTIHVTTDDGARLYLGGQRVVDAWRDQPPTTNIAVASMVAGQLYPIILEMYGGTGDAGAKLEWSAPTVARQVVPKARLYSKAGYTLTDAVRALRIAGGTVMASGSDVSRLNVATAGVSASRVDAADATKLARKAVGLDGNP